MAKVPIATSKSAHLKAQLARAKTPAERKRIQGLLSTLGTKPINPIGSLPGKSPRTNTKPPIGPLRPSRPIGSLPGKSPRTNTKPPTGPLRPMKKQTKRPK